MTNSKPEPVSSLRERFMYLRGLADAAPKTGGEPRDQLLRQIVDLLGEVVEKLCELDRKVREGTSAEKPSRAAPEAGTVGCPICGERLVIGQAISEGRKVEVTCPNCGTEMEIEP